MATFRGLWRRILVQPRRRSRWRHRQRGRRAAPADGREHHRENGAERRRRGQHRRANVDDGDSSRAQGGVRGRGAILVEGGTVDITDGLVRDNATEFKSGGGIFNSAGTVNLDRTMVLDNASARSCGGIVNSFWVPSRS